MYQDGSPPAVFILHVVSATEYTQHVPITQFSVTSYRKIKVQRSYAGVTVSHGLREPKNAMELISSCGAGLDTKAPCGDGSTSK